MDNAAWRLWTARNIGVALAKSEIQDMVGMQTAAMVTEASADSRAILHAMISGLNEALRLLSTYDPGIAPSKDGEHA